jgi:hypothetical protein
MLVVSCKRRHGRKLIAFYNKGHQSRCLYSVTEDTKVLIVSSQRGYSARYILPERNNNLELTTRGNSVLIVFNRSRKNALTVPRLENTELSKV